MPVTTTKSAFWRGFRDGSPFILGAAPFGLLFGVLATEAGMNLVEVMSMGVLVIAGASQFTALAQMQENAPVVMVLAAALAVNMRMAMYSAALAPHLGPAPFWQRAVAAYILVDNTYAVSAAEFHRRPDQTTGQKMAFYIGCAIPVWVVWYAATLTGALLGQTIPPEFALDFAVPIAFLAIVAPMLRTIAHVAAALTSMILGLALAFLPYSSGLLIAAAVAMIVGSEIERRMGDRFR
ncbi:MAG: AzlC family ABC transporter permease [Paracoccaceae bacterium]